MRVIFIILLLFVGRIASAQVLVSEEPRHKPVFQNNQIRILNVNLPPADTTQYHRHALPSVFLCLSQTTTVGQLLGKEPVQSTSRAGYMWFEELAPPHDKVHRVWNVDTNTFHVLDIELLSHDTGFAATPLRLPNLATAIDTPWARAYTLTLEKQNTFVLPDAQNACLLVAIDAAQISVQQGSASKKQMVTPGTYFWLPPMQKFSVTNQANTTAHFALIELPQRNPIR